MPFHQAMCKSTLRELMLIFRDLFSWVENIFTGREIFSPVENLLSVENSLAGQECLFLVEIMYWVSVAGRG